MVLGIRSVVAVLIAFSGHVVLFDIVGLFDLQQTDFLEFIRYINIMPSREPHFVVGVVSLFARFHLHCRVTDNIVVSYLIFIT